MRIRRLLTPGWLATLLGVVMFSSACFTVLAPWQFRRDAEREQRNTAIEASFRSPAVPVTGLLRPDEEPGPATEWRQVSLTGRYLASAQAVVRLRIVLGQPAFEVLTPFELSDGSGVFVVNRGFVRPVDGTKPPSVAAPPAGQATVVARARTDESDGRGRPAFTQDGHRQVYLADSRVVAEAAGLRARPGYFQLTADQPGVLDALPLPELSGGPFFSYALQWLGFGFMAIAGLCYLAWQEVTVPRSGPRPSRSADVEAVRAVRSNPTEPPPTRRPTGTAPRPG